MRFNAEHRFKAPVEAVVAVLVDPSFHRQLELPDLTLLDAVEDRTEGEVRGLRLRYQFTGHLDPMARRLLGDRRLTWIQELHIDPATGNGHLGFEAEADPRRLHGAADVTFDPRDGGTRRRIDGELVVAVPLIGGSAERRIVPGLLRRLDIEARAVNGRLGAC